MALCGCKKCTAMLQRFKYYTKPLNPRQPRADTRPCKCNRCLNMLAKLRYYSKSRRRNQKWASPAARSHGWYLKAKGTHKLRMTTWRGSIRRLGLKGEENKILSILQTQTKCDICGGPPMGKQSFHIDHCHTTNTFRGLLCHQCNIGLGNFKDNPELLVKAIAYLKEHTP